IRLLSIVQLVYNTSLIKTTKILPFFANYGYKLKLLEGLNTNVPKTLIKAEKLYILYKKLKEELEFVK
ncbi:hypothetical protein NEUTE2DRAFT_72680, partial [Neurospora tetrasperma FGSC 2509]